MNIVCRREEIKTLTTVLESNRSEFLAIYGRRRVGKTFLIRTFFSQADCLFFHVTGSKDGSYKEQILHFTQRIGEAFLSGIDPKVGDTWDETFRLLNTTIERIAVDKKIVLFIDELPWMATPKSKLLQTIDYYWNQYWSNNPRIKLIVCGSSASWIIDNIINNKGGLHNRITNKIHLRPFNLSETREYLEMRGVKLKLRHILDIYKVTGGIPFYLSHISPGRSAIQAIEQLAFSEQAILYNEFDNLFSSLFNDADAYVEIIEMVARSRDGIGQEVLFNKLTKSAKGSGALGRLKALEDAGFIMSFTPHFHKKRGIYYRVIDEYTLFYLHWIAPLKKTRMKEALERGYWKSLSKTPKWYSWSGYAFETVCYSHLRQIRKALDLPVTAIPNVWRFLPQKNSEERGAQIDLLFDRDDGAITLCEIKSGEKTFTITRDYASNLQRKVDVFKSVTGTQKQLFLALISESGLKENTYSGQLINDSINLDVLFS